MTKFEKLTLVISGVALVLSLLTPIATYYWFDTATKDYKLRARFVGGGSGLETSWNNKKPAKYFRQVINVGERPAEGVQVAVMYEDTSVISDNSIAFSPPTAFETKKSGQYYFYTLATPIPVGGLLTITIEADYREAYLYTKYGDQFTLSSFGGHGAGD